MLGSTIALWRRLIGGPAQADAGEAGQAVEDERRVWVRYPANLETTYQPAGDCDGERLSARVRNISLGGINLLVNRSFQPGELLSVELPGADAEGLTDTVLACVVHASAQGDGEWALGCTFSRELTDEDLETFGARRVKHAPADQRTWMRFPTKVTASYEMVPAAQPRPWPTQVLNISPTGVGLLVAQPVAAGALLSVAMHGTAKRSERTMLACVVHVTPRGEGEWALGCNFIRSLSEADLQALV